MIALQIHRTQQRQLLQRQQQPQQHQRYSFERIFMMSQSMNHTHYLKRNEIIVKFFYSRMLVHHHLKETQKMRKLTIRRMKKHRVIQVKIINSKLSKHNYSNFTIFQANPKPVQLQKRKLPFDGEETLVLNELSAKHHVY